MSHNSHILLSQNAAHKPKHLTCASTYVNGHCSFRFLSPDGIRTAGGQINALKRPDDVHWYSNRECTGTATVSALVQQL